MKIIFFFFTAFIFTVSGYTQYLNTSYKDAQEIKKRILLVGLPEDNKSLLSEYEEDSVSFGVLYKNDMEGQRQALKEVVLKHWKFSDSIVIVSQKETKALIRKYPDKYAVMKLGEHLQDKVYIRLQAEPPQVAWGKREETFTYNFLKRYNIRMLGITSLVIELPKKVIEVYLPKISPSEGDYIYAITQINYILSYILKSEENNANKLYREITNNVSGQLKDKILLLDGAELNCKEEEIKKVYPYPFRIVNYAMVEKTLKARDSRYAVLQSSRTDPNNSTYYLSNAGDGTIYCNYIGLTFNYGEVKGYSIQVFYPTITLKHFEQYGSRIE
jgi:hypothetical protein